MSVEQEIANIRDAVSNDRVQNNEALRLVQASIQDLKSTLISSLAEIRGTLQAMDERIRGERGLYKELDSLRGSMEKIDVRVNALEKWKYHIIGGAVTASAIVSTLISVLVARFI